MAHSMFLSPVKPVNLKKIAGGRTADMEKEREIAKGI